MLLPDSTNNCSILNNIAVVDPSFMISFYLCLCQNSEMERNGRKPLIGFHFYSPKIPTIVSSIRIRLMQKSAPCAAYICLSNHRHLHKLTTSLGE